MFERIDTSGAGSLDLEAWMGYIRTTHAELETGQRGNGDAWLETLIDTLRRACMSADEKDEEERLARLHEEEVMARMAQTFELLSLQMINPSDEENVVRKSDLVKAQGADFKLYEKIDTDQTSFITRSAWSDYFLSVLREKEEKTSGSGDKWISALIHTLEDGCMNHEELALAERLRDLKADSVMDVCSEVFSAMMTQNPERDQLLRQGVLIKAQGGDFKLFKKLDIDETGEVTRTRFLDYMRQAYKEREAKKQGSGEKYIHTLMHTLLSGCMSPEQIAKETAARREFLSKLMSNAEVVYSLLASKSEPHDVIEAEVLMAAYPQDETLFSKMDLNGVGTVTKEEWLTWLENHRAELEKGKDGSGMAWLEQILYEIKLGSLDAVEREKAEEVRREQIEEVMEVVEGCFVTLTQQASMVDDKEPVVRKIEFVKAHGGDFKMFEKISKGRDHFTMSMWMEYMRWIHEQKEQKHVASGNKWVNTLIYTLHRGCLTPEEIAAEDAAKEACLQELRKQATVTYELVSSRDPTDSMLRKPELMEAYPEDESLFDHICEQGEDSFSLERWLSYFEAHRSKMEKQSPGDGDRWMLSLMQHIAWSCLSTQEQEERARLLQAQIDELFQELEKLFMDMTGGGHLKKGALVHAHGGDFGLWKKLDPEGGGMVTKEAWNDYMQHIYHQKESKRGAGSGVKWARQLIKVFRHHVPIGGTVKARSMFAGFKDKALKMSKDRVAAAEKDVLAAELEIEDQEAEVEIMKEGPAKVLKIKLLEAARLKAETMYDEIEVLHEKVATESKFVGFKANALKLSVQQSQEETDEESELEAPEESELEAPEAEEVEESELEAPEAEEVGEIEAQVPDVEEPEGEEVEVPDVEEPEGEEVEVPDVEEPDVEEEEEVEEKEEEEEEEKVEEVEEEEEEEVEEEEEEEEEDQGNHKTTALTSFLSGLASQEVIKRGLDSDQKLMTHRDELKQISAQGLLLSIVSIFDHAASSLTHLCIYEWRYGAVCDYEAHWEREHGAAKILQAGLLGKMVRKYFLGDPDAKAAMRVESFCLGELDLDAYLAAELITTPPRTACR